MPSRLRQPAFLTGGKEVSGIKRPTRRLRRHHVRRHSSHDPDRQCIRRLGRCRDAVRAAAEPRGVVRAVAPATDECPGALRRIGCCRGNPDCAGCVFRHPGCRQPQEIQRQSWIAVSFSPTNASARLREWRGPSPILPWLRRWSGVTCRAGLHRANPSQQECESFACAARDGPCRLLGRLRLANERGHGRCR